MDSKAGGLTYQQVVDAWNAQADEYNQWCELDDEEKVNWTVSVCLSDQGEAGAAQSAGVRAPALVGAARKVLEEFGTSSDGLQDLYQALKPHITPPAARPAPVQEPVAWMWEALPTSPVKSNGKKCGVYFENPAKVGIDITSVEQTKQYRWTPLYTAPPAEQRKPLTVWQPIETAPKSGVWIVVFDNKGEVHPDYWLGGEINQWAKEPFDATNTHWMPLPDVPSAHGITEGKP